MIRKPKFNSQEQRNKIEQSIEFFESKLSRMDKDEENHKTYNEALMQFLPKEQRKYVKSDSYLFLCMMLKKFLEEKEIYNNRMALKVAKDNFEHFCETEEKNHDRNT